MPGSGPATGSGSATKTSPNSSRRSPGRSFSLSIKSKGKLPMRTGLHDRRWDLDFGKGGRPAMNNITTTQERMRDIPSTPESTATTENSLRRTVSSEDQVSFTSSNTSAPPPHPPPKDPLPRRPPDIRNMEGQSLGMAESPTLLQTVRMKMSTKDQEAMRKLRLTMDMSESVSGSGSSAGVSPLSPNFGGSISASNHGQGQSRPPMGSRRSTLSRQMISEDLDDQETQPPPLLPIAAQHAGGAAPHPYAATASLSSDGNETLPVASADFVIAVIGHKGVGKSTVIRRATRAWGVSSPVTTTTDQGYSSGSHSAPRSPKPGFCSCTYSVVVFLPNTAWRQDQAFLEGRVSGDGYRALAAA